MEESAGNGTGSKEVTKVCETWFRTQTLPVCRHYELRTISARSSPPARSISYTSEELFIGGPDPKTGYRMEDALVFKP